MFALLQIIRILEKLSPKQAHLFDNIRVTNSESVTGSGDSKRRNSVLTRTALDSSIDIATTAFPFLLQH